MRWITGPGPDERRRIEAEIVIGRQGDIVIDDSLASRRHAAVRPVQAGVEVEDLGSANGTFVDGQRIEGKVTLAGSATLRIGDTELGIEISLPQVTRVSGPGVPDLTVARPVQPPPPEVTVARSVIPTPPTPPTPRGSAAGAAAAAPGSPGGKSAPPDGVRKEFPNPKLIFGAMFLVLAAIVAIVVIVAGGGSSSTEQPTTPVAALKPHCAAHPPHLINDGFPEPKMVYSHNGVLDYTLKESTTSINVDGRKWPAMAYNGQIPGPTLVICPGDHLRLNVINGLPLPTNIHLHGMHVSPSGDSDNIFVDILPFESHTFNYQIPYDQPAGTFWYHPHFNPYTQAQVESGLAGGLLVQGSLDDQFANIPTRLMVIEGGREVLGQSDHLIRVALKHIKAPPLAGPPQLIVNGVNNPTVKIAPGQLQRWRLANATSDRELRLKLPGVTFEELAVDGITLHDMIPLKSLLIPPGSRMDVLVRGPAAGTHQFISEAFQKCYADCLDPFAGEGQSGIPDPQATLMTVDSSGPDVNQPMPTGTLDYPKFLGDLRTAHVDVHRKLLFARNQLLSKFTVKFPLNGSLYNPNHVDVTMRLGSVEQWTLVNPATKTSNEWHTFHIHTNPFQVISVNGHKLNYVLWEDNIDLAPGETAVIRIHPIDFTGKAVFHCHLLFHEDEGMMGVFQILKNPPQAEVNKNLVMYMVPPAKKTVDTLLADVNRGRPAGAKVTRIELLCHPLVLT